MDAKEVGKKIAELRKKNKMTQRELALKLNVIDKTISRWECGYGLPDLTIVPEIAAIFNVSIEEIIGENPRSNDEGAVVEATTPSSVVIAENEGASRKNRALIAVAFTAAVLAFLTVGGILLYVLLPRSASLPDYSIKSSCLVSAQESDADYVFITAFGLEECMSLELWGGETGKFTCHESWKESENASVLECKVFGSYSIDNGKIFFYAEQLTDPANTEKLRLNEPLGLDCFTADLEYAQDGALSAVVFFANIKNSETSVFGRWTKHANYFSRVESEIYFERVPDGVISFEQCLKLPEFAVTQIGVTLPYRITLELDRYDYYVGEVIEAKDVTVKLVYSDGNSERFENYESDLIGKELTVSDNAFNVYRTIETGKMTASVKIRVRYGYSWERAEESTADFTYFTHYNTDDWISFGCLQLIGTEDNGTFIYSENCGKEAFTSSAVVLGGYEVIDGVIHFVSTSVYVHGNYQSKFYINSEGDYFIAYIENGFDAIAFKTGYFARNLFGHFCKLPCDSSFSREEGEVYFEVLQNGLSERAKKCVKDYSYMQN